MIDVVGIVFNEKNKVYYFDPANFELHENITVIVNTERGMQFGKVVEYPKKINSNQIKGELKPIVRIATKKDYQKHMSNKESAKEALKKCKELVEKLKLNMQIIDAEYTFDRNQLMFRFIADNRIDFRELARELATIYKTRIELRQVGVRDKAKEISGLGLCGRKLCCSSFLEDLESVSINMAKNQNLSLNPNKINGVCGRLLCCLKYEDETYCCMKKDLPAIGTKKTISEGTGKVVSVNILRRTYKVEIPEIGIIEVNFDERN